MGKSPIEVLDNLNEIVKNDSDFIMMMFADDKCDYVEFDRGFSINKKIRSALVTSKKILSVSVFYNNSIMVFYCSERIYSGFEVEQAADAFLSKLKEELSGGVI